MNCEELVRKMNNKENDFEILNELIYETQQSTDDLLNQTEGFMTKIGSGNGNQSQRDSDINQVNFEL